MNYLRFIRDNLRWLAGGILLAVFSSFGQTFYIALSAGSIREEYGLSHGEFGGYYMLATLGSALTLPYLGRIVDYLSVARTVLVIIPSLAFACVVMAYSGSLMALVATIYLLRLFGQGMMTHTAMTAMGRWYSAQRGRAVSITTLGNQVGEAILPVIFVYTVLWTGWRNTWLMSAVLLLVVALPVVYSLMRLERTPQSNDPEDAKFITRHWTRSEVLRDTNFWLLLCGVMAPGIVGTTIFFHQIYLIELRGWDTQTFVLSFSLMSAMTIVFALICGQLIDRFSAIVLLPVFLLPLGAACLVLAWIPDEYVIFLFMALLGISYGFSSTMMGALWPEVYGTRHLGSIRSLVIAILVFGTALGPGVTGYLIDIGISYPAQLAAMGYYSLAASGIMLFVSRRITRRHHLEILAAS